MKIFHFLKEQWYRLLCGFPKSRHKKDYKVDILLIYLKEVGIQSVENTNIYYCLVTFKDGTTVNFRKKDGWGNKVVWMSEGTIIFNKENNVAERYNWDSRIPSWETIFKFKILSIKQKWHLWKNTREVRKDSRKEERANRKVNKIRQKENRRQEKIRTKKETQEFYEKNIPIKVNRKLKLKNIDKKT